MTRTRAKAEAAAASPKTVFPLETLSPPWPTSGASAIEGIRRMSELQIEVARFAADCARKNAATMAAFATCRSPTDFMELWRKAATDAVTDFVDEAERLLERAQE